MLATVLRIQAEGYTANGAENAGEALSTMQTARESNLPIQVFLLDVDLPDMDGVDFAAELRLPNPMSQLSTSQATYKTKP